MVNYTSHYQVLQHLFWQGQLALLLATAVRIAALLKVMYLCYTGSLVHSNATLHCLLMGKQLCCHCLQLLATTC